MSADAVITLGIDPGDTAGFFLARWEPGGRKASVTKAFQCDGGSAVELARWICAEWAGALTAAQVEAFDNRPRPHGLHGTSPDRLRTQVTALAGTIGAHGIPVIIRTASEVKNWATDARLTAAGLYQVTAGAAMSRHARDAARHSLFCAHKDCAVPDPLSRKRAAAARAGHDVPG